MKYELFKKPDKTSKLEAGDIFQTSTGIYCVGIDRWTPPNTSRSRECPPLLGLKTYRLVTTRQMPGFPDRSPCTSMFTHKMWEQYGYYNILPKGVGLKLVQENSPKGGFLGSESRIGTALIGELQREESIGTEAASWSISSHNRFPFGTRKPVDAPYETVSGDIWRRARQIVEAGGGPRALVEYLGVSSPRAQTMFSRIKRYGHQ